MSEPAAGTRARYLIPLLLIVSLFFLWGAANNLNDVLMKHFKKAFTLSDFQTGLVQSAFYFGYFCFAVPAALFMKRYGYKAAVVLGLGLFGAGALLFVPAANAHSYGFFLVALYVLASGLAFLETSANPLITVLGDPGTAESRLNFAQSFNPLGSIAGVLIGSSFILSGVELTPEQTASMSESALQSWYAAESQAVKGPYIAIGLFVLAWAALVAFVRFPAAATEPAADETGSAEDYRTLISRPRFMGGVIAQFFYVGAQVGVWSYLIRYTQVELPGTPEKLAAQAITASLALLFVGRFLGAALMQRVAAATLLTVFSAINVVLCIFAALVGGGMGLAALIATSLFMSIMYPTIFALSIRGLGPLTKAGSSLLVMAIIGGAVLTALMGFVSDVTTISAAMLVPAACFAAVLAFARSVR
ncbi:L-fucose:H+ symporter permease [Sphingomonas sp. AOB5]|uniref:L-fucose:H+ symporter permease n=1 Tax=Sphingomonas sp. AOB5 TaxID=3034017 RepID=UPI0023FA4326|nr:L-fucose:H+ symporter permease [Sphingomonas sp. AOB5]MDF7774088.1 L-fucose:H+ symporter permease [Sphingomonas sp. AOB5]